MNSFKSGDRIFTSPDERAEGWHWPSEWQWPTDFRKFMCWIFLGTFLQYLTISLRSIPYTIHQHHTVPLLRSLLMAPTISVVMAAVSGMAWWTIWKGKSSAKGWAIATSLIYLLIFLRQFIIPLPAVWDHRLSALFTGTVGLVAFLWRDKQVDA